MNFLEATFKKTKRSRKVSFNYILPNLVFMECTCFVWSLWIWCVLCTQAHVTKDETLLMSLGATGSGAGKRNSTPCLGNCLQQTKWTVKVAQSCPTLCDSMDLHSPWNSPGQNTAVGICSLLQGIFPTQGSNSGLLHCRMIF